MPTLYHRTTAEAAQAIIESGFRDSRGHFGFETEPGVPFEVEGVWLSDVPLDESDMGHAARDVLLAVTLDEQDLIDCEVVQEGNLQSYREWLVPAAVINSKGRVRIVPPEEESELPSRF